MEQLALVALGREAGLALGEIAAMFAADGRARIDRRLLSDKARQTEAPGAMVPPRRWVGGDTDRSRGHSEVQAH